MNDTPPLQLQSGTRLAIHDTIAAGSFGHIHRATWLNADLPVAVKSIRQERMTRAAPEHQRQWAAALEREGRFLGSLRSPHVVRVFEHSHDRAGQPVLVLEALDTSLHQQVIQQRPALSTALDWLGQIARGLSHIHRRGMRHLDLKPHNILLTAEGPLGRRVKIADFGTCTPLDQPEHGPLGTPGWMAPEQLIPVSPPLSGNPTPSYRSSIAADGYALGLLLFFMVTGEQPGHCRAQATLLRQTGKGGAWAQQQRLASDWALRPADRAHFQTALAGARPVEAATRQGAQRLAVSGPPTPLPNPQHQALALLDSLLSPWPAERLPGLKWACALP